MRVAICTPVYGDTKAGFTASLVGLVLYSSGKQISYNGAPSVVGIAHHMLAGNSSIADARQRLAETALVERPDFLLWLDADHMFPRDTLFRLAAHNLPVVGCNYLRRTGERTSSATVAGAAVTPKKAGLEPVDTLGLGVCLMQAGIFAKIPAPWFDGASEDRHFCRLAVSHGVRPHVDHALSLEVGHIAETVLTLPR